MKKTEVGGRIDDNTKLKQYCILLLPYLSLFWVFNKAAQFYHLAPEGNVFVKLIMALNSFGTIFTNPFPSLKLLDVICGFCGVIAVKAYLSYKNLNAKKYRKGREYGSARWGTQKDIKPFINPKFENNILLTQTERIMIGQNKIPKYNINKNVLVIGGSGSGKTRFHIKPNLMQMNASYIVTDPKGLIS